MDARDHHNALGAHLTGGTIVMPLTGQMNHGG